MSTLTPWRHAALALGLAAGFIVTAPVPAGAWDRGVGVGRPGGGAGLGGVGGPAAVGAPGYHPAARPVARPPAAYVRPVPVPVYPAYSQPSPAAAAAVGMAAGVAVGAAAASAAQPAPTTVVVAAPAPAPMTIGYTMAVLPAGCTAATVSAVTYYRCGAAWVRPYMQGSTVSYVVVPAP